MYSMLSEKKNPSTLASSGEALRGQRPDRGQGKTKCLPCLMAFLSEAHIGVPRECWRAN